ncbi:histone H4-like TAF Taf6, SAGA complex subunit [Cryptotrichosporon argae]
MGIYSADSVQEVASSLPLDPLVQGAANVLAGDVEFRLHLLVQEARKFMVHGKRTTLTSEDVEHAMEALNVEPVLIPPRPLPLPAFQPVSVPSTSAHTQQIYHTPDDEIDFATYLKEPLPPGLAASAGVKWKAHWLAVEGVQPAIQENPAPSSRAPAARGPATGVAALRPSAKSHLSTELQLYFIRLTTALIPPSVPLPSPDSDAERHRLAALASVRSDAAVAGILAYLVRWVAESITKSLTSPLAVLGCLVDTVEALLDNESVFVEPYLHQFLAPLLSILLTIPLGPFPPVPSSAGEPSSFDTRLRASSVLKKLVDSYGPAYPGLVPRLLSTLTRTLNLPPFPSPLGADTPPAGRYEGAVLGLAALGPHAVRQTLWGNGGDKLALVEGLVGSLYPGEARKHKTGLMKAVIRAMQTMTNPKPADATVAPPGADELAAAFGANVARALEKRGWTAREMLRLRRDDLAAPNGHHANDADGDADMTS